MKCLIVDDEAIAIKVLKNYIEKISSLEVVASCHNATDAFSILQKQPIDLLFLDIQMPKLTGFGLLKLLPNPPYVFITTAHREYALESFDFTITDYLLKPISFERFLKALGKVQHFEQKIKPSIPLETKTNPDPSFFYVRSDRQFVKIQLEEVLYIESLRNHVRIVTLGGKLITLTSITEMQEKLPPQHFLRVHRSYLVAISKITQFNQTSITLGEKVIPIGGYYKQEVMKQLENLVF